MIGHMLRAQWRDRLKGTAKDPPFYRRHLKDNPEDCRTYKCSPFLMGWELHHLVRTDPFFKLANHQPHHVYLGFGKDRINHERIWNTRHRTLFDYGIRGPDPVKLYCFYDPPSGPEAIVDREHTKRTPTWEMGIAGGGELRQETFPDPIKPAYSRWDVDGARFLNIQILNSVAFNMVTGLPVPQTPVTAQVYAGYGFQFMKEYEDGEEGDGEPDGSTNSGGDAVDPAQANPILAVKSVSERDSLLQAEKSIVSRSHVDPAAPATACKACEVRAREFRGQGLCDQILRPCNHAVCADCRSELVVEMMNLALTPDVSRGAIFLCPLCGEPVMETVPLAGPMKVPGMSGCWALCCMGYRLDVAEVQ